MRKINQLTLNLFNEPTVTQLVIDFAEEELICAFYSLCSQSGQRDFFLFPLSEIISACRRERQHELHQASDTCGELMMRGCIDEMRVGTYECASCFTQLMRNDVEPKVVGTHPMNFISERDRR